MKEKIEKGKNMNDLFSYPTESEINTAVRECCGRVCRACETPVAYAWRARNVLMSDLMNLAIENDLTETEKRVIRMNWFDEMSMQAVAAKLGVTPSAASHTAARAQKKLESVLKYAALYASDSMNADIIPAVLGRARAVSAARAWNADSFGKEIKKSRLSQSLGIEETENYAGLKQGRLRAIENGSEPTDCEKLRLCAFFAVTPGKEKENDR